MAKDCTCAQRLAKGLGPCWELCDECGGDHPGDDCPMFSEANPVEPTEEEREADGYPENDFYSYGRT